MRGRQPKGREEVHWKGFEGGGAEPLSPQRDDRASLRPLLIQSTSELGELVVTEPAAAQRPLGWRAGGVRRRETKPKADRRQSAQLETPIVREPVGLEASRAECGVEGWQRRHFHGQCARQLYCNPKLEDAHS